MAKRLTKVTAALTGSVLLMFTACGKGSDPEETGDGDGDTMGDGDGDGDGDNTGGSAGDGDGDTGGTPGDGDGDGVTAMIRFAFDSDLDGLRIDWEEPDTWSATQGMGGAGPVSGLKWTGDDGDPEAGAAQASIPFDFTGGMSETENPLQKVHLGLDLGEETDLTGSTISVQLKLVSGGSENCPINGKIFAKSGGSYIWGDGGAINLVEGAWTDEATMVASNPGFSNEGYDESAIVQIGIEISPSNGPDCITGDVVVLIDSISY